MANRVIGPRRASTPPNGARLLPRTAASTADDDAPSRDALFRLARQILADG